MSELNTRPDSASRAHALEEARQAIAKAQSAAHDECHDEATRWYGVAIERAGADVAGLAVRADALRGAGIVHQSRAEWSEAERDFLAAREAAVLLGDEARIGRAENCLAAVAFERGDWTSATRHYDAARASAEACDDAELLAQIENNAGTLLAARGEYTSAEAAFRRALERFSNLEQHPCGAKVLNNLGLVLVRQGRYPQATIAYDRALEECKRRGEALFATKILINQARLALARQNPIQAHAAAMKAWTFARRLKDGPVASGALCLLGEVALGLRDFVGAIYYLRRALKLAADNKAPLIEAETWVQIGNLYQEQGQKQRAIDTWQYARLCYRRLGADAEADRLGERIDEATSQATPAVPTIQDPKIVARLGPDRTGTYA